jgi:hypothetical protein
VKDFEEIKSYDWFKYHWEFMRRGEYKTLYDNISDDQKENFPNPNLSFNDLIAIENKDSLIDRIYQLKATLPRSVSLKINDGSFPNNISLNIDFSEVNSVKSLKRWVSKIIDDHYNLLVKDGHLPKRKKVSMVDYDIILKVGDLKRKGLKNREIAEIIDPRKFRENPESAIRLVSYYYQRFKKLISGEYKKIVFP